MQRNRASRALHTSDATATQGFTNYRCVLETACGKWRLVPGSQHRTPQNMQHASARCYLSFSTIPSLAQHGPDHHRRGIHPAGGATVVGGHCIVLTLPSLRDLPCRQGPIYGAAAASISASLLAARPGPCATGSRGC